MSLNRHLALALIAAAGALSAGAAAAHPDVRWAVNVNAAPVAVQVASDRGYGVALPVVNRYGYPVYREPTRWDRDADGVPDRYEYRSRHHHHHHRHERWERREPDSDRDGVPDRYDRRPYNPYRR